MELSLTVSNHTLDRIPSRYTCADSHPVSMEKKIFRADDRYASDHLTMESINATKGHWKDLMPRKRNPSITVLTSQV
jgi:hypothetical protein